MFDVEDHTRNENEDSPEHEEESFDPEAAEEELATLSSHLDAATYRQLVLIRQLDESGHWANAGATTCAAWLSWRIGMNENAARERLRIGHRLRPSRREQERRIATPPMLRPEEHRHTERGGLDHRVQPGGVKAPAHIGRIGEGVELVQDADAIDQHHVVIG